MDERKKTIAVGLWLRMNGYCNDKNILILLLRFLAGGVEK